MLVELFLDAEREKLDKAFADARIQGMREVIEHIRNNAKVWRDPELVLGLAKELEAKFLEDHK